MDTVINSIIQNAEANLSAKDKLNTAERDAFEQFMMDVFLNYQLEETKQYHMRRDPNCHDRYAAPQMENMWWVWKSRAEIARGEQPEAYPI